MARITNNKIEKFALNRDCDPLEKTDLISVKSSISSLVKIWKIRHSSPGCSFVWILRVVYFPVKHLLVYILKIDYFIESATYGFLCLLFAYANTDTMQSCTKFRSLTHIAQVWNFFIDVWVRFSLQVLFVIIYMGDR